MVRVSVWVRVRARVRARVVCLLWQFLSSVRVRAVLYWCSHKYGKGHGGVLIGAGIRRCLCHLPPIFSL